MAAQPSLANSLKQTARMCQFYRWLFFGKVIVDQRLPSTSSLLLAAHYNGLPDGFAYTALSPNTLGVSSAQWHRTALGRWLLPGISLVRSKDAAKGNSSTSNTSAFKAMLEAISQGANLLYFPEGTSRLGQDRLPVQRGTELLLRQLRQRLPGTPVWFAAAHYEAPTRWRSRLCIAIDGPFQIPEHNENLSDWVATGLLRAQTKAYARLLPARNPTMLRLRRMLACLMLLPMAPAALTAQWAIRRFADDHNVIALWRILGAFPIALFCNLIWILSCLICSPLTLAPLLAALVPALSLAGIALWQS